MTTTEANFVDPAAAEQLAGSADDGITQIQKYLTRFGYLDGAAQGLGFDCGDHPDRNGHGHSHTEHFEEDEIYLRSEEIDGEFAADHVLDDVDGGPTPGVLDEPTVEALKQFQEFNGLEPTGLADEATIAAINTPRCGNPDSGAGAMMADFTTGAGKWNSTNLTYSFQNYSGDLPRSDQRWAIDQAFGLWSAETPLRFRRVADGTTGDIVIRFVTGNHGDGAPFDGGGGVLAHAFYPSNSGSIRGDSHFDDAERWTVNVPTGAGRDLVTVAAHEFGHALGLRHSDVRGSLMWPSYSGPQRQLHSDDAQGIRSLYGGVGTLENATWVHGNAALIERPANVDFHRHYGFFNRIVGKAGSTNWFHFALPTPVIEDSVRLVMDRFMLRATTGAKAVLRDVHIRDGERVVARHNFVNRSGSLGFEKFAVASMPPVRWGVSISLGFSFEAGTSSERRVDLISAGMDYKRP